MELHYLVFDFSDEASGRGSFDAMASVLAPRHAPLLAEVAAVLGWARRAFGPAGALQDDGEWDCALQALADAGPPLQVDVQPGGAVTLRPDPPAGQRIELTLTLTGSPAFCEAFAAAFGLKD